MSETNKQTNSIPAAGIHRRGLLTGATTGATLAAGARPASAAGEDDELTCLHAALVRIGEETRRLDRSPASYAHGHSPEYLAYEAEATELDALWYETMERMHDLPATGPAGLRAKARAMRLVLERCVCTRRGQSIADLEECGEHPDRFAWSLARDALTQGAGA